MSRVYKAIARGGGGGGRGGVLWALNNIMALSSQSLG